MFDCQFTENKPPYSLSCLIALAIDRSPNQRLAVGDIYVWIEENFPFFRPENPNWKVSPECLHLIALLYTCRCV